MTYLDGLEAQTVIWIVPEFREPHLSAIRWLTENTADGFGFFAVRVRVVRIGDSPFAPVSDHGRVGAIAQVKSNIFNCLGAFSDAGKGACNELKYRSEDLHAFERAFKTPSLRGVSGRAPYMHAGQIATLAGVVEHYNRAFAAPSGHSEISPLGLNTEEKAALIAFLQSL